MGPSRNIMPHEPQPRRAPGRRRLADRAAFSLIEVLVVTTVMLILAATAIPQIGQGAQDAKTSVRDANWHVIQQAIELYRLEHGGRVPQVAAGSLPQLLYPTKFRGQLGPKDADHRFGPYLLEEKFPLNPVTGSRHVRAVPTWPPGTYLGGGWLYHEASGRIMPDGVNGNVVAEPPEVVNAS